MKLKIEKSTLLQALGKIQGITGRKSNIPITSNVLLSTEENRLRVLATDLEIAFQGMYEAEVLAEGSSAIPSRKLFEIVRDFPSNSILLSELENKWIQIVDKNVEYNMVGMDTEDFPTVPSIEGVDFHDMDGDVLENMIEKTLYAVLTDEGRAHLAGVFFETVEDGPNKAFRMVSTDGHRLSRIEQPMTEGQTFQLKEGVIVPKSGVGEVQKLVESEKAIQLGYKENNLVVRKDNEILIIRLVEGEFPDYELVIPRTTKTEVRVGREAFLSMIKRMSILSSEKYKSMRMKIGEGKLEATTTNPDLGESREVISVKQKGGAIQAGFNPRYFIESLGTMKSEEVVVKFSDETTPCTVEGEDDPGFLSVIMPMRI